MNFRLTAFAAACAGLFIAGAAQAEMKVSLGGGWDGRTVPAGQQCGLFKGKGMSPSMTVSGLPEGAAWIYVEFNDRDYKPLSRKGGHGIIGYPVSGSTVKLHPVPEKTKKLPGSAKVIRAAKSSGKYASRGYLAPCSGGKGNRYFADVKAVSAKGKALEVVRVELGKY